MDVEKYRVLILDDDFELGELLREYLQNTHQCAVTYVTTEDDFWTYLEQDNFDILFLDYKLPHGNGLEILGRMNQAGYNIPTVMMTGEGSENVAARAIQAGALDYLVKGEYAFSSLPPLIHKAVRLREMQLAMEQYLEQIRYQALLLDNMRDAVVVWGLDGEIMYWNAAAEQLYGAPASQRLGRPVDKVYFSCFDPPIQFSDLNQSANIQIEHRFCPGKQEKIWISAHITRLYNEGSPNELIGYMNVARDITPRRLEQEELIKSQNFVQRILDTSPNIIYIFDLRIRRITYVNPEIKAILGYDVDQFANASFEFWMNAVHPNDRSRMAQHLQELQSVTEGEVREIEFRLIRRDGERRWVKSRETVFSRSQSGAPLEVIGVIQDITASKLAQEKLQRRLNSEKLLSTLSNNFLNLSRPDIEPEIARAVQSVAAFIPVDYGAFYLLENSQWICCSPQPNRIDGSGPAISSNLRLAAHPDSWLVQTLRRQEIVILDSPENLPPEAAEDCRRAREAGLQSTIVIPMVSNNVLHGILVFGDANHTPTWTDEEDLVVLKTFGEIVTSALVQKQVDQALRKSEARYRAIVDDHQTEMICRFLPNTTLTFVNQAYCTYYSLKREQLVGTSFLDPIVEEDQRQVRERLTGLSTARPVHVFEQRVRLPGGEVRWQEWVSRAIFDQHNDFIEYQAVGRDITERKKMEEQVKVAQTRLTQAARLSSIGELASGVAHQISNPLTTIIADAQILMSELGREHPGHESAEAIVEAGWRAQRVINELMKFAQPAQTSFEPVQVNETIQTALLLASAHIQAAGVSLKIDLQPDLPIVGGNPRQMTDLWVNLLLLARSAFKDGKEHTIRIVSRLLRSNIIQVEVADDGEPIPDDQMENLFEPQLIPTGSGRGTGIELSICREIVRQNRGNISITRRSCETSVQITFPVYRD